MALFTRLFERDHHPYDVKGRWYKLTVASNGTTASIQSSDTNKLILSDQTHISTINGYRMIEFCVIDAVTTGYSQTKNINKLLRNDSIVIPAATSYSSITYLFLVVEG